MATLAAPGRSAAGRGTALTARTIAIAASIAAGAIYVLIGFGVVSVGTTPDGEAPGMLEFGLMSAAMSCAVAALVWRFRSRALWIAVAALQVLVIVFYVAVGLSGMRTPPFELWGILIKACQAVVLVALGAALLRGDASAAARRS
jgi:hypothetical protein